MERLQAQLRSQGQFVPLDPAQPDRATVGGVLAVPPGGTLRPGYGDSRNLVLGLRAALVSGEIISAGGKTVKNVTGYDLRKLLIGSLGTLAVILEATLRTYPLPSSEVTTDARFDDFPAAWLATDQIIHSQLLPASLELANFLQPTPGGVVLAVRLHGAQEACLAQAEELATICSQAQLTRLEGDAARKLWAELRDFPARAPQILARLAAPPQALARLVSEAARRAEDAGAAWSWRGR